MLADSKRYGKNAETGDYTQCVDTHIPDVGTPFRNQQLKRRIFRTVAERFAGKTHVFHVEPELDPGDVRNLADAIGQVCGGIAVVASCQSEGVFGLCLISRTLDVRPLGKAAFGALHGRGGGRADAVQGSVQATEAEIRNFFEAELNKIL